MIHWGQRSAHRRDGNDSDHDVRFVGHWGRRLPGRDRNGGRDPDADRDRGAHHEAADRGEAVDHHAPVARPVGVALPAPLVLRVGADRPSRAPVCPGAPRDQNAPRSLRASARFARHLGARAPTRNCSAESAPIGAARLAAGVAALRWAERLMRWTRAHRDMDCRPRHRRGFAETGCGLCESGVFVRSFGNCVWIVGSSPEWTERGTWARTALGRRGRALRKLESRNARGDVRNRY